MEKNRLEAFSDGVIAIIITIMVLELKLPEGDGIGDLLKIGPTLIAYLLSFMFVAIYWVNHHLIFHDAERINVKILWCNIAWLFVMSFIPNITKKIESTWKNKITYNVNAVATDGMNVGDYTFTI